MSSAVARTACCGTAESFAPAMTSAGAAICGSRLLASWPLIAATLPITHAPVVVRIMRSEERRVAQECARRRESRWWPNHQQNHTTHYYDYFQQHTQPINTI